MKRTKSELDRKGKITMLTHLHPSDELSLRSPKPAWQWSFENHTYVLSEKKPRSNLLQWQKVFCIWSCQVRTISTKPELNLTELQTFILQFCLPFGCSLTFRSPKQVLQCTAKYGSWSCKVFQSSHYIPWDI